MKKLQNELKDLEKILLNCGHTEGLEHQDQMTLAEFLSTQTINGLCFASHATEIIYDRDAQKILMEIFHFIDFVQ